MVKIIRSILWLFLGSIGLLILYLLFLAYPQPAFRYHFQQENLVIYSDRPLPPASDQLLKNIHKKISDSEWYEAGQTFQIFFCNDPGLFRFIANFTPQAAALNNALFNGHTFVRTPDIASDRIIDMTGNPLPAPRTLTNTIAHEITHAMTARHLGRRQMLKTKPWLIEGYADFIGIGPSMSTQSIKKIRKMYERPGQTVLQQYEMYHAVVSHLLEVEGYSPDFIFEQNKSLPDVMQQLDEKAH